MHWLVIPLVARAMLGLEDLQGRWNHLPDLQILALTQQFVDGLNGHIVHLHKKGRKKKKTPSFRHIQEPRMICMSQNAKGFVEGSHHALTSTWSQDTPTLLKCTTAHQPLPHRNPGLITALYGNWLNQFNVNALGCLETRSYCGQEVTRWLCHDFVLAALKLQGSSPLPSWHPRSLDMNQPGSSSGFE